MSWGALALERGIPTLDALFETAYHIRRARPTSNWQFVKRAVKKSAGGHKGVVGAARALDPIPRRVPGKGYLLPR